MNKGIDITSSKLQIVYASQCLLVEQLSTVVATLNHSPSKHPLPPALYLHPQTLHNFRT